MEQEFLDKLEAMDLEGRQPNAEKGLLDLPADLMYEVFGPLDARSLLETAKSHDTLRKNVMDWPDKRWEIVHLSSNVAIIDYETFDREETEVLLENAVYKDDNEALGDVKSAFNITELPYELLIPIMERFHSVHLLWLANGHPKLFRAAKSLKNKEFCGLKWLADGAIFSGLDRKWTHAEAEALLAGASVLELTYDLSANTSPDVRVGTLTFQGDRSYAHKCAGLIEKWKPSDITFPKWNAQAFNSNPALHRVLKDVGVLYLNAVPVDWLLDIPEWKFTELRFHVSAGRNVTPQIQAMFQKLYDQWIAREREEFLICLYVDSKMDRFRVGGYYPEMGEPVTEERGDHCEIKFTFFHSHCFSMEAYDSYYYHYSS